MNFMRQPWMRQINYDGNEPGGGGDAWFKAADAEIVGHIQTKGWDKLKPEEVALEAIKAHRGAEKMIGVPADQLLRLPKAEDSEGQKAMWRRLGMPDDAKGYDFAALEKKGADGVVTNTKLLDALRATAAEAMLPKDAAARVAAGVQKHLDAEAEAEAAERVAKIGDERKALDKDWGANAPANRLVASQAAARLAASIGLSEQQMADAISKLENQIGYGPVMKLFHGIGTKIGEDKFVQNPNPGGGGLMTKEQAIAKKAELMADTAWGARYLAGGSAENRELVALLTIINGE